MKLTMIDTMSSYRKMIGIDKGEREALLGDMLEPFDPMLQIMGMNRQMISSTMMKLDTESAEIERYIQMIEEEDVFQDIEAALNKSLACINGSGLQIPDELILGLYFGDSDSLAASNGYTGFGGIPGYIMLTVAPSEKNIGNITAAAVHEFQHNLQFLHKPFNPMTVSLKEYMIVEGLAERFAVEICGEEHLGPWVKEVSSADVENMKGIIKDKLDDSGFENVSRYLFGGGDIPLHGGYACGYYIVDSFLKNTGCKIFEAMTASVDLIIEKSYFLG